jgi:hypothetical protein
VNFEMHKKKDFYKKMGIEFLNKNSQNEFLKKWFSFPTHKIKIKKSVKIMRMRVNMTLSSLLFLLFSFSFIPSSQKFSYKLSFIYFVVKIVNDNLSKEFTDLSLS